MSIPVELAELAAAMERYGTAAFALTTGEDGRPHATHVPVTVSADGLRLVVGRRTAANVGARPGLTLLWPAVEPDGYSLIVDGTGAVAAAGDVDPVVTVVPTRAVLHRPAPQPAAGSDGRRNDCVPIDLGPAGAPPAADLR